MAEDRQSAHDSFHTEACSKFSGIFIFEKGSRMNTPALVSYPSSGNSWLRYLLRLLTGIYNDSIYNEPIPRLGKLVTKLDTTAICSHTLNVYLEI